MPAQFELSKIHPDFETILDQIITYKNGMAATNPQVWKDFMASSAGQVIMELMAGTTTYNQFYIESAFRECFPHTALRDSSIYAIARLLGVKIERKRPAALKIKIINTGTSYTIIGKNSVFYVDGVKFFNRTEIALPPLATSYTTDQYIYEGEVKSKVLPQVLGPGDVYLGVPGFVVSSFPGDLVLSVMDSASNLTVWTEAENSLFTYGPTSKVYYANTTGDGDVVLTFGDNDNGALPGANDAIRVQYVITSGSKANKAVSTAVGESITVSMSITYPTSPAVRIYLDDSYGSSSGIYGGSDEKSSEYYKTYSPYLFRAKQRAVTKADYVSMIMGLGGISSVLVEAQRDLNPSRVDLMNVITVCALPSSTSTDVFTTAQKDSFIKNLNQYIHACIRIDFVDASVLVLMLSFTLYVKPTFDTTDVKNEVQARIISFFDKGSDSLGKSIYLSDMMDLCMTDAVDHCSVSEVVGGVTTPFTDKIPASKRNFYRLDINSLQITSVYTSRSMVTVDTFL